MAVWGTGREGRAALALCQGRAREVLVVDDRPGSLEGVEVHPPGALGRAAPDIVIRSPGVPVRRPELEALRGRGVPVTTLLALWLEDHEEAAVLGVTGSKGKSTTVALAASALAAADRRAGVGGNIGVPATDLPEPGREVDVVVLEVSSFQAADLTVSPPVGVLTLLAPDHLDWHGTYQQYVADKCNLFAHRPGMAVVVNATDPAAWGATVRFPGRQGYGRLEDRVGLTAGAGRASWVTVDGEPYCPAAQAAEAGALRGRHQLLDLCGALAGVRALIGEVPDPDRLLRALGDRLALPCRLETVADDGLVEVVDDALASNPAGTVAALEAFEERPMVLVAGGADRGVDFSDLARCILARRSATSVVLIGPAGARLGKVLETLGGAGLVQGAPHLEAAVTRALEVARTLGRQQGAKAVVLFSPAAPTPAEEGSYAERSARLRRLVGATGGDVGRGGLGGSVPEEAGC